MQQTTTVETGLSDFHKMIVSVLSFTFPKHGPTVISYRNYKKFNETVFRNDRLDALGKIEPSNLNYTSFDTTYNRVLGKHAPIKDKYVLAVWSCSIRESYFWDTQYILGRHDSTLSVRKFFFVVRSPALKQCVRSANLRLDGHVLFLIPLFVRCVISL